MTFKVKVKHKLPVPLNARDFAIERHGDQDHGCLKIADHLANVHEHVVMHYDPDVNIGTLEEVASAAWLHDIIEDTDTCPDEIYERFGQRVGEITDIITDKAGKNRLERHLRTYHMIRRDPDALLIKLCDRRHNQERSLAHGEHWLAMYLKEYTYFKFALWDPGRFRRLWSELDEQHEQMKKKMSW